VNKKSSGGFTYERRTFWVRGGVEDSRGPKSKREGDKGKLRDVFKSPEGETIGGKGGIKLPRKSSNLAS